MKSKKALPLVFIPMFVATATSAAQHDFQAILECHASPDKPGLAVRIDQSGKQIFSGALGVANIEEKLPLNTQQVFQIGSITKQFTAAAILQLVEGKKLSLNTKLSDVIVNIDSDYADATIERVLSHTSGLPNYTDSARIRRKLDSFAPVDKVIKQTTRMSMEAEAGEKYFYSNTGYVLLGKVIELVSGVTYREYLKKHIFEPLEMNDSYIIAQGEGAEPVVGYTGDNNTKPQSVDRSWIYAAGAIASTLDDMSKWHSGLKSGKVISEQYYQQMVTKAKLSNGEQVNYGFGFDIYPISGHHSYSHQGSVPGFMSWSIYFPEQELFATAFSNKDTFHPGPALLDMIARQLTFSPDFVEADEVENKAQILLGKYKSKQSGTMDITFEQGNLYAQVNGENKRKLRLRENNSFSYQCTEDYFSLRQEDGEKRLVPVSIYAGEQAAYKKYQ